MKTIALTQGYYTLVDDIDYEYLNQFNWHVQIHQSNKYARHSKGIFIHKIIAKRMGLKTDGLIVTFKDGNGLNNQRSNIITIHRSFLYHWS